MRPRQVPPIECPHCGVMARVRSSEQITALVREVRYRCSNDACACQFLAQIEIVRMVQPSLQPAPTIMLPSGPRRPANDDMPLPANDPANDDVPDKAPAKRMT